VRPNVARMSKSKQVAAAITAFGWPPIMPTPVATAYACCSRWTLARAVDDGKVTPAGKRGRSWTFRREDLDHWLLGETQGNVTELSVARAMPHRPTTNAEVIARLRAIAKPGSVNGNGGTAS